MAVLRWIGPPARPARTAPSSRARARARNSAGTRVLSVAARRGPWLGVVATELPNGQLAWVNRRNPALHLRRTAYSLHADLSGRWLELRRHGRRIRRITVAVGRPGSETPTGRFAVTDKLNGRSFGSYYGCCVLALNGHQPKLPAGWSGGDRLAIHGTNSPGHDRRGGVGRLPARRRRRSAGSDAARAARNPGVHQELSF